MTTLSAVDPKSSTRAWAALETALADKTPVDLSWITPRPTKTGWTLAPDMLELLSRLVPVMAARHIVEFGAGLSTRVLTRAGLTAGRRLAISSLDHDPEFGPSAMMAVREMLGSATPIEDEDRGRERGRGRIGAVRANVKVRFQLAPVVVRDCGHKLLPVYHWDRRRLASQRAADLILIDGPPINLGTREGVFYQALEVSRPGTLVLLDDAHRASEQAAVRHWQETLGERIEARPIPGFAHGLVAVMVNRPLDRKDLLAERTRRSVDELVRLIPEGSRVAMVDRDYWGKDWLPARRCEPFVGYPPATDAEAIAHFDQIRGTTDFWVITWPSFWWLDFYRGLIEHVRQHGQVIAAHDRLMVVDLRG